MVQVQAPTLPLPIFCLVVDESQNRTHARSREGGGEGGVDLNSKSKIGSRPRALLVLGPRGTRYSAVSDPSFALEIDNKDEEEEEEEGKKEEKEKETIKRIIERARGPALSTFSVQSGELARKFSLAPALTRRGGEREYCYRHIIAYSQKIIN